MFDTDDYCVLQGAAAAKVAEKKAQEAEKEDESEGVDGSTNASDAILSDPDVEFVPGSDEEPSKQVRKKRKDEKGLKSSKKKDSDDESDGESVNADNETKKVNPLPHTREL